MARQLHLFLLLSLLIHPYLSLCKTVPQTLKTCVVQALLGSDVTKRIVTRQDDTYTDARLGEKIQCVQNAARSLSLEADNIWIDSNSSLH